MNPFGCKTERVFAFSNSIAKRIPVGRGALTPPFLSELHDVSSLGWGFRALRSAGTFAYAAGAKKGWTPTVSTPLLNLPVSLIPKPAHGTALPFLFVLGTASKKERVSVYVFRIAAACSRQIARVLRSGGLQRKRAACQRRPICLVWWSDCLPWDGMNVNRYVLSTLHSITCRIPASHCTFPVCGRGKRPRNGAFHGSHRGQRYA